MAMSEPTTRSRTVLEVRISPRGGGGHHPRGDVDGDATDVALAQLDLAGVEARPDLDVDAAQLVPEGGGAADRPAGAVEGRQDPVAGGLDELTTELLDQPAGKVVVDLQQLAPAPVPEAGGPLGGAGDIGEQHGRQHPPGPGGSVDAGEELLDVVQGELGCLPDEQRVGSWKLDQLRLGEVPGEIAGVLDGDEAVVPSVQDQRGCLDQRQQGAGSVSSAART
jgi:hypothetical protein